MGASSSKFCKTALAIPFLQLRNQDLERVNDLHTVTNVRQFFFFYNDIVLLHKKKTSMVKVEGRVSWYFSTLDTVYSINLDM